jgi:hypothetical protein
MVEGGKTLSRRRRPRRRALLLLLLVPLVGGAALVGHRRFEHRRSLEALFASATDRTHRRLDARLTHPRADRHRPLSVRRDNSTDTPAMPYRHLWQLERAGDAHGVVAAQLQLGQPAQALARLQAMPPTADVESDRAAVLLLDPKRHDEALTAADRALELAPHHPQAHWNRALILESLDLPLAAARSFRASANHHDPGWSEEALTRAARAESQWQQKLAAVRASDQAADEVKQGRTPDSALVAREPEKVRAAFLSALEQADSPAQVERLRPLARAIDSAQRTTALVALADRPERVRRMKQLFASRSVVNAQAYRRLADEARDPLLSIRSWLFLGQALAKDRRAEEALAAYQRALDDCAADARFPEVCISTKLAMAKFHSERRHLQKARRWALEARADSETSRLPLLRVRADLRLQAVEDFRKRFGIARAYAEELSLQDLDCQQRQNGREYLAKIATARQRDGEAKRHLTAVQTCSASLPRFNVVGTEALVELTRDPVNGWTEGRAWLDETLAFQLRPESGLGIIERLAYRLFEARSLVLRDPRRARDLLGGIALDAGKRAPTDEVAEMIRVQTVSALVAEAAAGGDFARALDVLEREQIRQSGARCLVGIVADSRRRIYLVRTNDGQTAGLYRSAVPYDFASPSPEAVPPQLVQRLVDCDRIGVLATEPILGAPAVLPREMAWGYLRNGQAPGPPTGPIRRLVVHDVRPSPELGLPPVGRRIPRPDSSDEILSTVSGQAATPEEVSRQMEQADQVELHVHGILDREIADEAALVLATAAPGSEAGFLTASQVQRLRLTRNPGVVLGACHGARSAGYGAFEWNLSLAFMRAGARWVIASPQPVDDAEAEAFFQELWDRIRAGAPVPVALRDARQSERWQRSQQDWVRQVVAFY